MDTVCRSRNNYGDSKKELRRRKTESMKVLFAAGGTGGHINPALSVAQELKKRCPDADILFVGTADKMESKLVPAAGFDFTTIKISGFQRKITIKNIFRNIQTIVNAFVLPRRKLLKEFKFDAVIGFGGYVSIWLFVPQLKRE